MAKLFFRYSAMDAGKTLDLIKVAYNYNDKGQETLVLTPSVDSRAGKNKVKSRVGFDKEATSVTQKDDLFMLVKSIVEKNKIACILIDEVQFFGIDQIHQLSDIVDYLNIPVICYGLRTDYHGNPFPASAHLLAIADTLEELKTICHCGRKANFNLFIRGNHALKDGEVIMIDDDLQRQNSRYVSVCRRHWKEDNFGR